METTYGGEKEVCSNGPDNMTKMAATPIYGKHSEKSSSQEPES